MVFSITLALLPLSTITALAAWDGSVEISDWYGDGTATDYYISTPAELAGLAVIVNGTGADGFSGQDSFAGKTVTLTADIDLAGTAWTPIGDFTYDFAGTFDGDDYNVTNLTIGSSSAPDSTLRLLGLFGYIGDNGEVKNLNVSVSIYSSYGSGSSIAFLGAIAGDSIGSIEGCSSSGVITGGYKSNAGGIAGGSGEFSYSGAITGCSSSCTVSAVAGGSAGDASVGGLVGYNERSVVSSCHATGNVTAGSGDNSVDAGGLIGTNYLGTVTGSYATGDVITLDLGLAGGLTGYNDGTIRNCHTTGSVTAGDGGSSGGFTGYNSSTGSTPNIINCYAAGNAVSGDSITDLDYSYAGGFVGRNSASIKDCYADGSATAGNAAAGSDNGVFTAYAGGFAAYGGGYYGAMENCYATGFAAVGDATVSDALTGSYAYVYAGGFAGYIYGSDIDNCHAANYASCGSISLAGTGNGGSAYAGGFAGVIYGSKQSATHVAVGSVKNSYSNGDASGGTGAEIGGFTGDSFVASYGTCVSYTLISNSFATGDVTGNSCANLGGFTGHNYYGAIENCYGAGTVSDAGSPGSMGGFAGYNEAFSDTALLENAYYDSSKNPAPMTGTSANTGTDHSLGLSTSIMTGAAGSISYATNSGSASASSFVDALNGGTGRFDLSSDSYLIWVADSDGTNGGYPLFAESWQDSGNVASSFAGGDGSSASPYQISSGAELAYLAKLLNDSSTCDTYKALYYVLTADIDLSGKQWVPIGESSSYSFNGDFDGDGYHISGLTVGTSDAADSSLYDIGLFGNVDSGAVIKNVGVSISVNSASGSSIGGIAGVNYGLVMNCWMTGSVKSAGSGYIGGLLGENDGTVQNCYVRGSLEGGDGAAVGGLVGFNNSGTVQNCYTSADVTGGVSSYIGGFIGGDGSGTVQNAYYDEDADQTLNGSAQSPKLGTGIEIGTMTGSVTQMSSADMTGAAFVDTLNGGISSLFDGSSLYNPWYTDSSTSPVNGGYPVFTEEVVFPTAANASNNTVSTNPASLTVGGSTTITAAGDRQSTAGSVVNDERYIPASWASSETGMSGTFTLSDGIYTSSYTPSVAGSYTVTASFQKQTWDGSTWNDASGSTDTKTVSLTVNSSGDSDDGGGSSGNTTPAETSQINLGSVTVENGTATATVDSAKLAKEISGSNPGSTIVLAITENVDKANFNLTVSDLKAIADSGSMLQLESPLGIYKLPATEIDFDSISKQYPNIGYKDIKVTVSFSKADGNRAILNGSTLAGQPVSITVNLTAGDKVIELDEFTKYVERDLPVPDGSAFTTGVVIEKDGTLRPVPTKTATINGKKYAAIFSRTNSIYCLISKSVSFDDMEGHWAKKAVNDMASRLILSGVGDKSFAPKRDITRAEFAVIIVRALGLKASDSVDFTDVRSGKWYYGGIAAAYKYGIVSGGGDGTFKPDREITRQEAAVMIARAMEVAGMDSAITDEAAEAELAKFIDGKSFSGWAKQPAAAAISSGLMVGSNGYARPEMNITRAETAVIVCRLLEQAGLI